MGKHILVVLGHPSGDSYCAALVHAYADSATAAGHKVRCLELGALSFDPVLRAGYRAEQPLEPELVEAQATLSWAQHVVLVYPTWWGSPPALLKGFFDRVLTPGFAFRYRQGSPLWDKLLSGRSAQLIVTMDTPPWFFRLVYRNAGVRVVRANILAFCGMSPVRTLLLGPVRGSTDAQRARWLERVRRIASSA